MKMERDIEYMEDAPEITGDELAQASEEQLVANLEADVKAYTKALEQAIKGKENYLSQLEVDEKIWAILEAEGSFKRVAQANFAFEDNPEYWELQRTKNLFKIRESRAMAQGTVKQFEDQIEATEKALADSKNKLAMFTPKVEGDN